MLKEDCVGIPDWTVLQGTRGVSATVGIELSALSIQSMIYSGKVET